MAAVFLRRLGRGSFRHPAAVWPFASSYSSSVIHSKGVLKVPVLGDERQDVTQDEATGARRAHSAASESGYGRHLPKVSERIINVTLVSPVDSRRHNMKAMWGEGLTLLDALKRSGVDTGCPCLTHERGTEVCMGNCAVLIASEWLDRVPPRTEDETEVIRLRLQTGAVGPPPPDKHIRLSCVLPLGPEHEGMVVGLTENVDGETP